MTNGDRERELLRQAPAADGWRFDPSALIRAVNALAGRDAGAVLGLLNKRIAELARPQPADLPRTDAAGLALVARLVFVSRQDSRPLPAPALGRPDIAAPTDETVWPFFPLALAADIPFLLVGGYSAGGALNLGGWLARCAELGQVRAHPLTPRSSPVDAADELIESPDWQGLVPQSQQHQLKAMIRGQALRASGTIPGVPEQAGVALASVNPSEAETMWRGYSDAVRSRTLRWDAASERFISVDERA